ncbi:hypothetical protein [Oceaniglobus ichthyenteri]|uniref:hypothetical protein n=1 Tax=Oceaniglobus ichthyenteri TaxID=2136177 RepID=UPI001F0C021B|nr:hypothetical protein [Oceaniglobus ichthyenteri]
MIRLAIILLAFVPCIAWAEMFTAPGRTLLRAPTGALIQVRAENGAGRIGASLFTGHTAGSLFAPLPTRLTPDLPPSVKSRGTAVQKLRDLIQYAESRRDGYDAVQHGARIKPTKPPTQMTLAEINQWIDATPGQPHAIGRYQFIPKTLRSLVKQLGLRETTRFSPDVQDQLADILLGQAGLHAAQSGLMTRKTFMNNLAKIWAGLPTATGKSYYHGYAGNKAALTWDQYEAEMRNILSG